jgi:hypothetical protein
LAPPRAAQSSVARRAKHLRGGDFIFVYLIAETAHVFPDHCSRRSEHQGETTMTLIAIHRRLYFSAALLAANFAGPAFAGPCDETTEWAAQACDKKAESDQLIALGKCENSSSASERDACITKADHKHVNDRFLCAEQRQARRKVCQALGQAPYDPNIHPANFVKEITNPYFPLQPGTTFTYRGEDAIIKMQVLNRTKTILGVDCVVVRDTKFVDGEVEEDTLDYFAQDKQGNVWYFGETTAEYVSGQPVSTAGSWIAGKDGAKPGIIMPASPSLGKTYRQEFLLGEAEDIARIEERGVRVKVPFGAFDNALKTFDFTPLEPEVREHKFYVRGVGLVLTIDRVTGEREELVSIEKD